MRMSEIGLRGVAKMEKGIGSYLCKIPIKLDSKFYHCVIYLAVLDGSE